MSQPPKKVNCIFIADQEKRVNRILRNTLFVSTYITLDLHLRITDKIERINL